MKMNEQTTKDTVLEVAGELKGMIASMIEDKMTEEKAKVATPEMQKAAFEKITSTEPEGWKSFGEFAKSVHLADTNQHRDPRLTKAPSGMNTILPSQGGHAVPETFMNNLMSSIVLDPANLAAQVTRLDGIKGSLEILLAEDNDRSGGVVMGGTRAYRLPEANQFTATKPAMKSITYDPKALVVATYVTDKLMSQAGSVIEQYITAAAQEAFNYKLNDEIIRGTGAAGQFKGLLSSGSLITVAKEVGQANDTIVTENIVKMAASMRPQLRARGVWILNPDAEAQLSLLNVGTGTGGALVFMPPNALSQAPFGTLYGRPILYNEHASALGDVGDVIFADLSQYMMVTGGPTESAVSMHLRFDYLESVFRWVLYCDGQPMQDTVYKPAKGANKSAYVTLAAR